MSATIPCAKRWLNPVELILLGAIWGASFLFARMSSATFGALPLVEIQLASGGLILLPFLWRARAQFPLKVWPALVGIGLLNTALPFLLFAWAAQRAPAGVGAILNAMTALFAALIGVLFFGERIGLWRACALAGGFAGVVVLASGKLAGMSLGWPVTAGTCAALMYGISINLVRQHLSMLPAAAVAAATLSSSALLVLPFALWQWPSSPVSGTIWGAALMLGTLCTGMAFVLYYRLIARIGASRASTVTYLIPVFGIAWAWWLLDEPLTLTMAVAGSLILGSVALSQRA